MPSSSAKSSLSEAASASEKEAPSLWNSNTWLLSPAHVTTVGLSGVLFAYLGYLMTRGFFAPRLSDILLSVLVSVTFGSMLFGVLPLVAEGISWQAHLAGFLTGIGCAAQPAERGPRPLNPRRGAAPRTSPRNSRPSTG